MSSSTPRSPLIPGTPVSPTQPSMLRRYYADNGFGTELRPNPWMVHQKAARNVVPWSDNFANWTRHNGTAVKNIFSLKGDPASAYTLIDNINNPLYPAYWECAAFALVEGTLKVWIEKAPSTTTPSMVIKAVNAGAGAGSIEFNAFTGKVTGGTMPSSNVVDDGNWWILIAKPTSACEKIQVFAPVDGQVGVPQVEFHPLKSLLEAELVGPIFTGINPGDTDVILYSWDFSNMSELGGRYYFDFEYKGQESAVLTLNMVPVMYVENGMLKLTDGTNMLETPIHPGIQKVAFEFSLLEGPGKHGLMRLTLNSASVSGPYDGSFGAGNLGTEYTIRNVEGWPCGSGRPPPAPFITTWRVGASDLAITLPFAEVPRVKINWGDGSPIEYVTSLAPSHTYATPGDYDVSVAGFMPRWKQGNLGDKLKIIDIKQWGTVGIENCAGMFYGCTNLGVITATDTPDFSASVNMRNMFRGCTGITHLDTSEWKTPMVTDMASMFRGCARLTAIDGEKWDTSHVTSMENMFFGCAALTSVRALHWDTAAVTDFDGMFTNCALLASLDTTNWKTAACTSMTAMFSGCAALDALRVTAWDVSNVQHMTAMFKGCASLQALDVEAWRPAKALEMAHLFEGCTHVRELRVGQWRTPLAEVMTAMFKGCAALTRLDLTDWDTRRVLKMDSMFEGCANVADFDIATWDMARVITIARMFYGCMRLVDIDVTHWDIDEVTDATDMFTLASLSVASYDALLTAWAARNVRHNVHFSAGTTKFHMMNDKHTLTSAPNLWIITDGGPIGSFVTTWRTARANEPIQLPIRVDAPDITVDWGDGHVETINTLEPTHRYAVPGDYDVSCVGTIPTWNFNGSGDVGKIVDVKAWGITNFKPSTFVNMFKGCVGLERLSASDTLVLSDSLGFMFSHCSNLTVVDARHWDTSAVLQLRHMFENCTSLTHVDTSTWITSNVTTFQSMFSGCTMLDEVFVANWDLSHAIGIDGMFAHCSSLVRADVSMWDVSNVVNFASLFSHCSVLTDIGGKAANGHNMLGTVIKPWDTSSAKLFNGVFTRCPVIPNLYLNNLNLSSCTSLNALFDGCLIADIAFSGRDVSKVKDFSNMYANCKGITSIRGLFGGPDISSATSIFNMFGGCTNLTRDHFSDSFLATKPTALLNASNVLKECSSILSVDFSSWDMSHVTTMSGMFNGCSSLHTLNLTGWDTRNVENFMGTFNNCSALTVLRIGHFRTPKVTLFSQMFGGCSLLTIIDVSAFDTSQASSGPYGLFSMFSGCSKLTTLDVSGFRFPAATTLQNMFSGCSMLATIDTSAWDTSNIVNMQRVFMSCAALTDAKVSGFDVSNVTNADAFLAGVTLTKASYDKLLTAWGAQTVQTSVKFSGGFSKYSIAPSPAATGRAALVADHWTITDGGPI